jgi:hypothetical protein
MSDNTAGLRMTRFRMAALVAVVVAAAIGVVRLWPGHDTNATVAAPPVTSLRVERESAVSNVPRDQEPPSGAQVGSPPNAQKRAVDWYKDEQSARDYVDLVRNASLAAESGDGGAARELTYVMLKCSLMLRSIRAGQSREAYLASLPLAANPDYAAHSAMLYDRCAPLATASGFEEWNDRPGGKWGVKYWRELALKNGDPAMKAEFLVEDVMRSAQGSQEKRAAAATHARAEATNILRSRDGEAYFKLGMRLGNSDLAKDVSLGYALALASCDLGYDCTSNNERNGWYQCRWVGGCAENTDLRQQLTLMSPGVYAKADARYQELKELLKTGSWDEIDRYVPLDGLSFQE